jgi:hypothetical protein
VSSICQRATRGNDCYDGGERLQAHSISVPVGKLPDEALDVGDDSIARGVARGQPSVVRSGSPDDGGQRGQRPIGELVSFDEGIE